MSTNILFDTTQTKEFVSKHKEFPDLKFTLHPLDSFTRFCLEDAFTENQVNQKFYMMVRLCVQDAVGVDIKREKVNLGGQEFDAVALDTMKQIHPKIVQELFLECLLMNALSETERKNSSTPTPSI